MTSEPDFKIIKCYYAGCDWTSQEPLDSQVLGNDPRVPGTDLRDHVFKAHEVLLSNTQLAKYIYQPGDRVIHNSFGKGTVVRPLNNREVIGIKFDVDIGDRTRNVTPRRLSLIGVISDDSNHSEESLSQKYQGAEITEQRAEIGPGDPSEEAEEYDRYTSRTDQPTAQEERLSKAETQSEEVGERQAGPAPITASESTTEEDPGQQTPAPIANGTSREEAEEYDSHTSRTNQPTDQEERLSEAETQPEGAGERQADPAPITAAESTTEEEPSQQTPSPIANGTSRSERDLPTISADYELPSLRNSELLEDLQMPKWVVLCIGIGECGTKLIGAMNKKPKQLPSRNPIYYPVHCSQFDTQEGSKRLVANKLPAIKTNTIRATEEGADFTGGLAADTAGVQYLGVGGKPYASYLSFKRIFDHANLVGLDEDSGQIDPILKEYDADYFENPLWRGQGGKKIGPHQEIRLSGDTDFSGESVSNYGVITFNSARGGTGSGGVSLIQNFIHRRSLTSRRSLTMGLSLNISILPDEAEKLSKDKLASYSVSSFYRLAQSDVHGVVLASNTPMMPRNNNNLNWVNDEIREMLVPIIVSPTGKYTVTSASSTTDQADISKAISSSSNNPGLCVIGYSEELLRDGTDNDDFMSKIAGKALERATCDWIPRSGPKPTGYRAFLSGPPDFFKSNPAKLTSDLLSALNSRILELSKRSGDQNLSSVNGDVSVQAFAQAESIRLSVLLYNVKIPEFDDLVKKGFDQNDIKYDVDFDGWDQILNLTEEQVTRLEGLQVGFDAPLGDKPKRDKLIDF